MASADVKHRDSPSTEPNMTGDGPTVPGKRKRKGNWRLDLLSIPKFPRGKYEKPDETFSSGVDPGTLTVDLSERNEHLSRPLLRTLVINKRLFSTLSTTYPNYEKRMDKKIEYSWGSIYNYYKKAKRDLSRKRSKSRRKRRRKHRSKTPKSDKETTIVEVKEKKKKGKKKGKKGKKKGKKGKKKGKKGKKGKKEKGTAKAETKSICSEKLEEELEKERALWVNLRSTPKVVPKPERINRGPIIDLIEMSPKITELAAPKTVTLKFSEQPIIDLYKIKEEALIYEPTERVLELAKPPAFRLIKEEPIIPGAVKPSALQAVASPRIAQLATPKETVNARDADLKEDPFLISPNALKYVATERILELARPATRK